MIKVRCNSCRGVVKIDDDNQRVVLCDSCKTFLDLNDLASYTFLSIGEFTIVKVVGRGAMGTVYEAIQESLDRKVALKILPPTTEKNHDEHVKRFLKEMKIAAQIEHPYIVSVHQAGEVHGFPYYSMNLVNGSTLQELVENNGALDERDAILISLNVAEAIESMWNEFRIIHRDIKPSNIMINKKSMVQVLDMGLAKGLNDRVQLTKTGVVLGSPLFLSPEQASEGAIDFRTDIFSLGATLYYLLTGHPPFSGSSIPEVLHSVIHNDFAPVEVFTANISNETKILLDLMMAKNSEHRFESWSDVIETFRYMLCDSNQNELVTFDTSRRQLLLGQVKKKMSEGTNLNFSETATAIIKNDCDVSSGEYPNLEVAFSAEVNPTYKTLIQFVSKRAEDIQGLTGIMDWVDLDKQEELKAVLDGFRGGLNEMVHVLRDFNTLDTLKDGTIGLNSTKVDIKSLSHQIKYELRKIGENDKVSVIFETNFDFAEMVTLDIRLFMRTLSSSVRYFIHGMTNGELILKLIKKEDFMELELVRSYTSSEPTYNPRDFNSHLDCIEGAYFFLALELVKVLEGSLSFNEKSNNILKFTFPRN